MPSSSVEALRGQLADTQRRADEAQNAAGHAGEHHARLRGLAALGESSAPEVAEAGNAVIVSEDEAQALAHGATILEERLAAAEEEERQQHLTELGERAADAVKTRTAAAKRVMRALSSTREALSAFDSAMAVTRGVRREVAELRDVEAEVSAIERRWKEKYDELSRSAPPGMEVNTISLELRRDGEIDALRQRIADEAAALAPDADAEALAEVVDSFADLPARLLDSASRKALAEGDEFVGPVRSAREMPSITGAGGGRYYGDFEIGAAEARHAAFVETLRRLAGPPAETIGAALARSMRPS